MFICFGAQEFIEDHQSDELNEALLSREKKRHAIPITLSFTKSDTVLSLKCEESLNSYAVVPF